MLVNRPDEGGQTLTGAAVFFDGLGARACLRVWATRGPAACLEVRAGEQTRDVTADMTERSPA